MNIDNKLCELEEKQREIADEIKKLRERGADFQVGKFYCSKTGTIIYSVRGIPYDEDCFCGVNLGSGNAGDPWNNAWNKACFHEVKPIWEEI